MTETVPVQQAAEEQWLSVGQTARRLGVAEDTVRLWVTKGKLTAAKTVLGRLIDPASVRTVEEDRRG